MTCVTKTAAVGVARLTLALLGLTTSRLLRGSLALDDGLFDGLFGTLSGSGCFLGRHDLDGLSNTDALQIQF